MVAQCPHGHEKGRLSSNSGSDEAGDHCARRVAGNDAERARRAFLNDAPGGVETSAGTH